MILDSLSLIFSHLIIINRDTQRSSVRTDIARENRREDQLLKKSGLSIPLSRNR
jgi:hypothetical protein